MHGLLALVLWVAAGGAVVLPGAAGIEIKVHEMPWAPIVRTSGSAVNLSEPIEYMRDLHPFVRPPPDDLPLTETEAVHMARGVNYVTLRDLYFRQHNWYEARASEFDDRPAPAALYEPPVPPKDQYSFNQSDVHPFRAIDKDELYPYAPDRYAFVPGHTVVLLCLPNIFHFAEKALNLFSMLDPELGPRVPVDRLILFWCSSAADGPLLEWKSGLLDVIYRGLHPDQIWTHDALGLMVGANVTAHFERVTLLGNKINRAFGYGAFFHSREESDRFRRGAQERLGIPHLPLADRTNKAFISVRSGKSRRLTPETVKRLHLYLTQLGYQVILGDLGELPFREQVLVASKVAIVVGMHGSAFLNMGLFMERQSAMVEIFCPAHNFVSYHNLAAVADLRHFPVYLTRDKTKHTLACEHDAAADSALCQRCKTEPVHSLLFGLSECRQLIRDCNVADIHPDDILPIMSVVVGLKDRV